MVGILCKDEARQTWWATAYTVAKFCVLFYFLKNKLQLKEKRFHQKVMTAPLKNYKKYLLSRNKLR